jgi:hypothetical protein
MGDKKELVSLMIIPYPFLTSSQQWSAYHLSYPFDFQHILQVPNDLPRPFVWNRAMRRVQEGLEK